VPTLAAAAALQPSRTHDPVCAAHTHGAHRRGCPVAVAATTISSHAGTACAPRHRNYRLCWRRRACSQIIQERLYNDEFVAGLLPVTAPLSTMRVITGSKWWLDKVSCCPWPSTVHPSCIKSATSRQRSTHSMRAAVLCAWPPQKSMAGQRHCRLRRRSVRMQPVTSPFACLCAHVRAHVRVCARPHHTVLHYTVVQSECSTTALTHLVRLTYPERARSCPLNTSILECCVHVLRCVPPLQSDSGHYY
jgi:hypothetical protein